MYDFIIVGGGDISGVYALTNPSNGKCYIGSSHCVLRRIREHYRLLELKEHNNTVMVEDYHKALFVWLILEQCSIVDLRVREQFYIDSVGVDGLYNLTTCVRTASLDPRVCTKIAARAKQQWQVADAPVRKALYDLWDQEEFRNSHAKMLIARNKDPIFITKIKLQGWSVERREQQRLRCLAMLQIRKPPRKVYWSPERREKQRQRCLNMLQRRRAQCMTPS